MLALTREVEDASFILSGRIHGSGKGSCRGTRNYADGIQKRKKDRSEDEKKLLRGRCSG